MTKPCIKCGAIDRNAKGNCRQCAKVYHAAWHKANPERVKAAAAEWYKTNPERVKVMSDKWHAANPEKVKVSRAKWAKANPEIKRAAGAKWKKDNPEKVKTFYHKHRARKLAAGGTFTAADIRKMLKSQEGKCVACKVDITNSYHIDHIMPLALGGSNGIQNIQLLCQHCNQTKGAKHPINFMQERGYLL